MDEIYTYLYETEKHGETIFLYTKLTYKKWFKILYPQHDISYNKLYLCMFITKKGCYFIQGDESDIELILESSKNKIKLTENTYIQIKETKLIDRIKIEIDRIKHIS